DRVSRMDASQPKPDPAPLPGGTAARDLLLTALASTAFTLVFVLDGFAAYRVPAAYALPAVLVVNLALAVRLARAGRAAVPIVAAVLGCAFVVGGAAFDIFATVLHSPNLSDEGNPVARALLDAGHPVAFLYGYAAVGQSLYLLFLCTLWV